jgi:hypothetical protein
MRPFKSGLFGLGLLLAASSLSAGEVSLASPSLLPVPDEAQNDEVPISAYGTARTAYTGNAYTLARRRQPGETLPQPTEQVPGYPKAEEPNAAMNGGVYDENVGCAPADDCTCGLPSCCCSPWFASVAGLVMGRNNPNAFWTT